MSEEHTHPSGQHLLVPLLELVKSSLALAAATSGKLDVDQPALELGLMELECLLQRGLVLELEESASF